MAKDGHLSLGGGHIAQCFKAVMAGCITIICDLADADGILDKQKLLKDEVLARSDDVYPPVGPLLRRRVTSWV